MGRKKHTMGRKKQLTKKDIQNAIDEQTRARRIRYIRRAAFSLGIAASCYLAAHILGMDLLLKGVEFFVASAIDLALYSGLE